MTEFHREATMEIGQALDLGQEHVQYLGLGLEVFGFCPDNFNESDKIRIEDFFVK